ncbi:MAG: acyl-CoA dehydrogenase family protein [Saprospiraceae bacterium]
MSILQKNQTDWIELMHEIGKDFESLASQNDKNETFVFENYEQLKKHKFFSAMIPKELGGGGMSYLEMCHLIKTMAKYCGSTALAFSMHQHLVAASVWKYKNKGAAKPLLEKVAQNQTILISTGAKDWLESNGEMKKVEGGYLLSAKKHFASQSKIGDIAISSAPYFNEDGEWQVLHFPVPMTSEGVSVLNDWKVMGMRATGSHTIQFDKVFIPETAIGLTRPRGEFHMVWNVVLGSAMALIMSAYMGIAEKALEIAIAKSKKNPQDHTKYLIGKLNNTFLSAKVQWKAMYHLNDNFKFLPNEKMSVEMLSLKTNVAEACKKTVAEAMEVVGGQGFYQKNKLERMFRDVQAAHFHPLPKWNQFAFTGARLLQEV